MVYWPYRLVYRLYAQGEGTKMPHMLQWSASDCVKKEMVGLPACHIVNIESGMPTVELARIRMEQGLRGAKAARCLCVKIIHGYGSTGKGGAIKADVQRMLRQKQAAGQVCAYVKGEDFSPFDAAARRILEQCPQMARDTDFNRQNHGVTIVLLANRFGG